MSIKTEVYKSLKVNAILSEEEAEEDDEYLQLKDNSELKSYRTQYLKRLFVKKEKLRINELIKLNESHQLTIGNTKFDGT